jgi:hypothetical protein
MTTLPISRCGRRRRRFGDRELIMIGRLKEDTEEVGELGESLVTHEKHKKAHPRTEGSPSPALPPIDRRGFRLNHPPSLPFSNRLADQRHGRCVNQCHCHG